MNKKIVSAVLAGACAVSAMGFSVSAATAGNKSYTSASSVKLSASASIVTAEINVSVPSSISAVINPYGVPIENKGDVYAAGVASPIYSIVNQSKVSNILINATASVTVPTVKQTRVTGTNATTGKDITETYFTPVIDVAIEAPGDDEWTPGIGDDLKAFIYLHAVNNGEQVAYQFEDIDEVTSTQITSISYNTKNTLTTKYTDVVVDLPASKANATTNAKGTVGVDVSALENQIDLDELEFSDGDIVFVDATDYKDSQIPNNEAVAYPFIALAAAGEDSFTYAQFVVAGDVSGAWTNQKLTLNVALDIMPTAYEEIGDAPEVTTATYYTHATTTA